ncbi:MAG: signal peptidase I [Kofleriaceae bacterium]
MKQEARLLIRLARSALSLKPGLEKLAAAAEEVESALASRDLVRVRHGLPALDSLVDQYVEHTPKSIARSYIESIGAAVVLALVLREFVMQSFQIPTSSMYPTLEINDHIFANKFIYGIRVPFTDTKLLARSPDRGDVIVFVMPCQPEKDYIKRVIGTAGDRVEIRCNIVYVNDKPIPSQLVQGEGCSYEGEPQTDGEPSTTTCSRYRETVDGKSYDTFHEPERPARDEQWARDGELEQPSQYDFPKDAPPHCPTHPDGKPLVPTTQRFGLVVRTDASSSNACALQRHYVVPDGHVFVMGDNRANSLDSRAWGSVPIENIRGKAMFTFLSYRNAREVRFHRMGSFIE